VTAEAGLSAQRTRLAWRRTAMSAGAVALLAARPAVGAHAGPVQVLAAAAALAGWVVLVAVAYRRARGLTAWPPHPGRRTLPAYALVTVGFALIGTLLVLA
jgi:hypothetical protein